MSAATELPFLAALFVFGLALNIAWENLHAPLYTDFKGGRITKGLLLFMALKDALVICVLFFVAQALVPANQSLVAFVIMSIIFALTIEKHALTTNRWQYKPSMPLIPLLKTGLTPTIQLAATGLVAYWLVLLIFGSVVL